MRRVLAALAVAGVCSACATPVRPPRLSASVAETFGGLYVLQQARQGRTDVDVARLRPTALCRRTGPSSEGPGEDWSCAVRFVDADSAGSQVFEVQAKADGCWRADGSATAQPAVVVDPVTGATRVNPLAEFDGCLDTSW